MAYIACGFTAGCIREDYFFPRGNPAVSAYPLLYPIYISLDKLQPLPDNGQINFMEDYLYLGKNMGKEAKKDSSTPHKAIPQQPLHPNAQLKTNTSLQMKFEKIKFFV